MNEADILEKAADLIESVGHCKDVYCKLDDDDKVIAYCAVGAIRKAAGVPEEELSRREFKYTSYTSATNATNKLQDAVAGFVPDWNDHSDRTAEEVVEKMKQVAKDLRNAA